MSRLAHRLILTFLFLSGATALVYQLVWSKHLAQLLGNSGQAHAVVLATFMGGLALGAYLWGGRADRTKSPLCLYGLLELGIGLYALVFTPILHGLGQIYLAVAPSLPEWARVFPKLLLAASSLVLPTTLMGGTLPALARHFTTHLGGFRRELARLYAVNSLGASFGVFIAGVRMVPNFGLELSSRSAALVNVVLALSAIALSLAGSGQRAQPMEDEPGAAYPPPAVRASLVGVLLSGFSSMLYEITWIRLLAMVLGASTYAFTFIVCAFILGIGLGSFWLTRRAREGDALRLFGLLQLGLSVAVCVALPLYVRLPLLFLRAQQVLTRSVESWPYYQLLTFVFCCLVLLLPTFLMGAAFPCGARVAQSSLGALGRNLGGVYLWNTVGTVAGSLLGGLVLMPAVGLEGSFAVGIAMNLCGGALALWRAPSREGGRALWPVGFAAAVLAVYLAKSWGWSTLVADAGTWREWGRSFDSLAELERARSGAKVVFKKDDTFATVLVGQTAKGHRYMRINGKVDASNGSDIETQILAGHMGPLLAKRPVKKVLLVGAGAAITAGSILAHDIERLDLVEISPAVIDAARLFGPDNRFALDDPRCHVHIEDAKTFMALADTKYDLVVSVPSNPWVTGVSGLFSKDFFDVVKQHLEPDGLIVQWVHTYESSEEILKLILRTFRQSFPHSTTWLGPQDLLFVGSRDELTIDPERMAERMQRQSVREDLARVDADDVVAILARQVHSSEGQGEFAGEGIVNTDDLNVLEYAAPVAFYVGKPMVSFGDERRRPETAERLALTAYVRRRPLTAKDAERIHRVLALNRPGNIDLLRGIAERWLKLAPDDAKAVHAYARAAYGQKELSLAASTLWPIVERGADADALATWLFARARELKQRRSVWATLDEETAALAKVVSKARLRAAEHSRLADAIREACETLGPRHCQPVEQR